MNLLARPLLSRLGALAAFLLLIAPLPARAAAVGAPEVMANPDRTVALLDDAVRAGRLSWPAAARQKLLYVFDRASMDPAWDASGGLPAKCATLVLAEIGANLDQLDAASRALYEARVNGAGGNETQALLVYETAHFHIEYNTTGTSAPPQTDVSPANGVPDFVEQTGAACEQSWTTEITNLGFTAPPIATGPNGRYLIQYQTQSSYGFTTTLAFGGTKIVLHPTYAGFPPNDDPDGDVLGAMRVTVAHEFKHASQEETSGWSEGGWVELDATWAEDIVYDNVNDYYNYIESSNSPFTQPQVSLDSGGSGSYEDCNWEHYQTEKFGNGEMLAFWQRRATHTGEAVLTTYAQNFLVYGISFEDAWGEYVAWNFACGAHAGAGYGYGEAATYPTTPAISTIAALPAGPIGGTVQHLAAATHLVDNAAGTLAGTPQFSFTGAAGPSWRASVLAKNRVTGAITRTPIPLVSGAGTLALTGVDYGELLWAAIVIGNPATTGSATYTFSASTVSPLTVTHQKLLDTVNDATPYAVTALVTPGTETVLAGGVSLDYRVNGGSLQTLAMPATGNPNEYSASIPAQDVGSTIEYRITATGSLGSVVLSPVASVGFHAFAIVSVFEPFELAGGFTVGDAGDAATTGVWERVIPVGTIAAPGADYTSAPGQYCYVTQNGAVGGADGLADVDGGKTTLLSPVYDLAAGGPYASAVVRYQRWYSNNLGASTDDVWRVDVSNDGGASWSNVETVNLGSAAWVGVNVDLIARFGTPGQVRLRFVADDSGTGSLVEAAVDEFEIIAVPQPQVGVEDGAIHGVALSGARPNPSQGPVAFTLTLPAAARVTATVRDLQGRTVRTLLSDARRDAGAHTIAWDGRGEGGAPLGAGVFFVDVRAGATKLERRVVVVR